MKLYVPLLLIASLFGCNPPLDADLGGLPTIDEMLEGDFTADNIIEAVISEHEISGLSIALVQQKPESKKIKQWHRSTIPEKEVADTTLFSAQSISKTFTSLACLCAVRDGLVGLDVPITNYISSFSVNSIHEDEAASKITLRHLLSHTSGLPPDAPIGNNFSSVFKQGVYAPLERRINSLDRVWLRTEVGSKYSYSNVGFDLVARIIEIRSGMRFHEYVKSNVLMPLGMKHSTFNLDTIPYQPNVVSGNCSGFDGVVPVKFSSVGAGGLYTCSKDMLSFLSAALDEFSEILDKDLYQELISIPFSDETSGYALGLTVNDFQYCSPAFGHTGNGFGFTSLVHWVPELEIGIAILSNRESTYNGLQNIQRALISEYSRSDITNLPCQDVSQYDRHFDHTERHYYEQLSGDYSDGTTTLTFEIRDDLFGVLAPDDGSFNPIHFIAKNKWLIDDNEIVRFSYKNGQVINQNNGMCFTKVISDPPKAEPKSNWDNYPGRYRSYAYGILESTEIIDLENGRLRLNGNPLKEYQPGLFFDQFGQVVDFRNNRVQIEYGSYVKID